MSLAPKPSCEQWWVIIDGKLGRHWGRKDTLTLTWSFKELGRTFLIEGIHIFKDKEVARARLIADLEQERADLERKIQFARVA